jgi:hypothetical protein
MLMKSSLILRAAICLAAVPFARPAAAETIYGIAAVGNASAIVTFDSANPSNLLSSKFLTGFGGTMVGIDIRPADGKLYGLGSGGGPNLQLYEIDPATGAVAPQGTSGSPPPNSGLNGFNFGFDWNPTIDRMRIVSETNQNLVASPVTWSAQTVATNLFYGPADPNFGVDPNVVHSAYINNFTTTQLYGIDSGLDILVTQANSAGTLGTVGPLGLDISAYGGFDISITGVAYAALLPANTSQSSLYSINLATGAATNLGVIDGGLVITAMAVAGVPEPATTSLLLCGLAAAACVRRRR